MSASLEVGMSPEANEMELCRAIALAGPLAFADAAQEADRQAAVLRLYNELEDLRQKASARCFAGLSETEAEELANKVLNELISRDKAGLSLPKGEDFYGRGHIMQLLEWRRVDHLRKRSGGEFIDYAAVEAGDMTLEEAEFKARPMRTWTSVLTYDGEGEPRPNAELATEEPEHIGVDIEKARNVLANARIDLFEVFIPRAIEARRVDYRPHLTRALQELVDIRSGKLDLDALAREEAEKDGCSFDQARRRHYKAYERLRSAVLAVVGAEEEANAEEHDVQMGRLDGLDTHRHQFLALRQLIDTELSLPDSYLSTGSSSLVDPSSEDDIG